MKLLESDNAIGRANKLIVEFIDRLPVMKVLGDGKSAVSALTPVGLLDAPESSGGAECLPIVIIQRTSCQ
jgi:hypothetical protein